MLKGTVEIERHFELKASGPAAALARWNALSADEAEGEVLACSGSTAWARAVAAARPFADLEGLLAGGDLAWHGLSRADWQQAFDSHPRLGECHAKSATGQSLAWSQKEQSKAAPSEALRAANARYEAKFGRIFLLCAGGRTENEILAALDARIDNDDETEWQQACAQQRLITQLRLARWLEEQAL